MTWDHLVYVYTDAGSNAYLACNVSLSISFEMRGQAMLSVAIAKPIP